MILGRLVVDESIYHNHINYMAKEKFQNLSSFYVTTGGQINKAAL